MLWKWMLTVETFCSLCHALRAILFLLLVAGPAFPADPPKVLLPCQINRVHDADSFYVRVALPFTNHVVIDDGEVRLQGADAWEVDQSRAGTVGKISAEEIAKGVAARDAVVALFKAADVVLLEPRRKGDVAEPHGRISAHVWLWHKDGTMLELSEWLKANGHVRPMPSK